VNDATFIARGLRAHKAATRKIHATERHIGIRRDPLVISAIQHKSVLKFSYNGKLRTVEPQTYGLSSTGKEVLRAHEISGDSGPGRSRMTKLFDLSKIKGLEKMTQRFAEALPEHNPDDSAMVEIFATLPARRD